MSIAENVRSVQARIAAAAERSGRRAEDIVLVAASKTNSAERVREALSAGIAVFGENRVQEMAEKAALGAYDGAELHFIGHLQRNKVKQAVALVSLIHGVDSEPLLHAIDAAAAAAGKIQDVLLEINVAGEETKSGFSPAALGAAIECASALRCVRVRGLMTVPPICASGEENRRYFERIKQLFIDNCDKKYDNVHMDFMSMGMSGDFETAIECGANMVRVGTAIFGERVYPGRS